MAQEHHIAVNLPQQEKSILAVRNQQPPFRQTDKI